MMMETQVEEKVTKKLVETISTLGLFCSLAVECRKSRHDNVKTAQQKCTQPKAVST